MENPLLSIHNSSYTGSIKDFRASWIPSPLKDKPYLVQTLKMVRFTQSQSLLVIGRTRRMRTIQRNLKTIQPLTQTAVAYSRSSKFYCCHCLKRSHQILLNSCKILRASSCSWRLVRQMTPCTSSVLQLGISLLYSVTTFIDPVTTQSITRAIIIFTHWILQFPSTLIYTEYVGKP